MCSDLFGSGHFAPCGMHVATSVSQGCLPSEGRWSALTFCLSRTRLRASPVVPGAGRAALLSLALFSCIHSGPGLLMPPLSLMLGVKDTKVLSSQGVPARGTKEEDRDTEGGG